MPVSGTDDSNGGSACLSVPGNVEVLTGYGVLDKAGICDVGQIYRIYHSDTFGNNALDLDLVLLFTSAHHIYMAGHLVLYLYIYDRKSTQKIYARTE